MQTGNHEDRIREIRKKLIQAQVLFEQTERDGSASAACLRQLGAPEDICIRAEANDRNAMRLVHEHTRSLLLFEIAYISGDPEDFKKFVDTFFLGKKTA
jgi:hypothetical protein